MTEFDESVIVEFADMLYRQAASIVIVYTMVGALVGAGIGAGLGTALRIGSVMVAVVVGAVVVGMAAYQSGRQKAFALRLQAQVALCQVQIEANTRAARS